MITLKNSLGIELVTGIISGIIVSFLGYITIHLYRKIKKNKIKKFWKDFINKKIIIVLSEYKVKGEEFQLKLAQKGAEGLLISKGSALALAYLYEFLLENVTSNEKIKVIGDEKKEEIKDQNYILIGGPAANSFSSDIISRLEEKFDLPFKILYSKENGNVCIRSRDDKYEFVPFIDSEPGVDYAIIIKAKYMSYPKYYVIILAGAYMYGSCAAALAVTNKEIINRIYKLVGKKENLLFLIRTRIKNRCSTGPQLEFNTDIHAYELRPKL